MSAVWGNPEDICSHWVLLSLVESMCDAVALGSSISVAAPFVRRCLTGSTMSPLIGRVEGWRACVARGPDPHHVSSPVCTENLKSDHSGDEVRPGWRVN